MSDDSIADYLRSLEEQYEDPALALYHLINGHEWPNCKIADCQHKVCTWATQFYCAPHSTHPDTPWTEAFPPGGKR
jgi:hypothetical protein